MEQADNVKRQIDKAQWLGPIPAIFPASFLTLSASLLNFLNYQSYPLLRIDTLAAFAVLATICAIVTGLYLIAKPIFRSILEALLVTLLVDINVSGLAVSLGILIVATAILAAFGRSISRILAVFGGIVLLATLAGSLTRADWITTVEEDRPEATKSAPKNRPAVIHIILDEHLGFGGFPDDKAGQTTREEMIDYYLDRGFRIYPRAYSEHLHTVNAIPDILDFGEGKALSSSKDGMVVGPNRTFRRLKKLGYDLTVYQSEFGDFCKLASVDHCIEYDQGSLLPTLNIPLAWDERTRLIMAKFFSLSQIADEVEGVYEDIFRVAYARGVSLPEPLITRHRTSTISALEMFDIFSERVQKLRPGEAVFLHSLFPHYPLATNADCTVKPYAQWRQRRDWTAIEERQAAYYEQLRCTTRQVDKIIAAIEASPAAENYIFVLHGDHGSRITRYDPLAHHPRYSDDDLKASFSTLLAIKISGRKGGVDNALTPVSSAIQGLSLNEYKAFPVTHSASRPSVMLDNRQWQPVRRMDLPEGLLSPVSKSGIVSDLGGNNDQ